MKKTISYRIGLIFLGLQILSVIYAQFIPERFFCWRPYDSHSSYKINVRIQDTTLTTNEIEKRYRYKSEGWEPRSIHNVISIVRQYELTYGRADSAQVNIIYAINGRSKEHWKIKN